MLYKLPVDISTFSELRASNYLYVDKTEKIYQMITRGRRYFLSRPRRFGKSLLVSTLKEILTANKKLFADLWIERSDYDWYEYGVIKLDFSSFSVTTVPVFQENLYDELITAAQVYDISIEAIQHDPNIVLKKLINALYKRFGRVAILVDEYDSPILKTLHDSKLAKDIRDSLQQFFTTIKSLDEQVQFVFITGVTSFARAGLFSGINNVQIITLDKNFAAICGYTVQEVNHYFNDYINVWARQENYVNDDLRAELKAWYNGYAFGHNVPKVYNPFSFMKALKAQEFANFWFESGMPTFLVEILKKEHQQYDLDILEASKDFLGIFDVDSIPPLSLMFQAGYLTIVGYDPDSKLYKLDYPNYEVKSAFQKYLLEVFAHIDANKAGQMLLILRKAFNEQDIERAIYLLQQLFAHVPYQLHSKEEKFYHALLMMVCIGAGIKAQAEYSTSLGRIDLLMEFSQVLYIVEIKFNQSAELALEQIEERRYYERFICQGKSIVLLGISFKREPHTFSVSYAVKKL